MMKADFIDYDIGQQLYKNLREQGHTFTADEKAFLGKCAKNKPETAKTEHKKPVTVPVPVDDFDL